jgi:hypothetical protein
MKLNPKKLLYFLQRKIKLYTLREFMTNMQAKLIGKEKIEGPSVLNITDEATHLKELRTQGFTEFKEIIDGSAIDDIVKYADTLPVYDPFNKKLGEFKFKDIPNDSFIVNFKRNDIVNNEAIVKFANDPAILRIVQEFLGAKPTISTITTSWSIAGKEKAQNTQLYHRDFDDFKFCKLFIYLTDVGINDGPHIYVKNSSASSKLTRTRRYSDDEIEKFFGKENVTTFVKPKGSFFLVDTYGFHKGKLPTENNRLLAQVRYSLNPSGFDTYAPISVPFSKKYNKYINRLLIS